MVRIFVASVSLLLCLSAFADKNEIYERPSYKNKEWKMLAQRLGLRPSEFLFIEASRSETGSDLISRAKARFGKLDQIVVIGRASYTDLSYGKTKSFKVYVNGDQELGWAILDLVHELTHLIGQEKLDRPLIQDGATSYIRRIIEGEGGEAYALWLECKARRELLGLEEECELSQIQQSIYVMPKVYRDAFLDALTSLGEGRHWEALPPGGAAKYISSLEDLPYPFAALKSYLKLRTGSK